MIIDLGITTGDVVYEVTLKQAFPTTMSAIELGDANTNRYVELNVQFSYKNWESKGSIRDLGNDILDDFLDDFLDDGRVDLLGYGKKFLGLN